MSITRTYKVNEIYFLSTRGFMFAMENFQLWTSFTDKKINLLANGKSLAVKLKGIECVHKKYQANLLLASLNDNEQEIMEFLKMDNQKVHLQNVENIYLEVEFFNEQEIQQILLHEQNML